MTNGPWGRPPDARAVWPPDPGERRRRAAVSVPGVTGRRLPFQVGPGASHMALDAALLRCAARGEAPPTLRFYRWVPPAISVGYGQRDVSPPHAVCAARGWHVVRRPTGGRGILHRGSLTYAIVLPPGGAWEAWSVAEATRRIHAGLAYGLRGLGIRASLRPVTGDGRGGTPRRADRSAAGVPGAPPCDDACCLFRSTPADLLIEGRRLGGSAQRRTGGAILQHGILLEALESEAWAAAFRLGPAATRVLAETTVGLVGDRAPAGDGPFVDGLAAGLGEVLGIVWQAGALESEEMAEPRTWLESGDGAAWPEEGPMRPGGHP